MSDPILISLIAVAYLTFQNRRACTFEWRRHDTLGTVDWHENAKTRLTNLTPFRYFLVLITPFPEALSMIHSLLTDLDRVLNLFIIVMNIIRDDRIPFMFLAQLLRVPTHHPTSYVLLDGENAECHLSFHSQILSTVQETTYARLNQNYFSYLQTKRRR